MLLCLMDVVEKRSSRSSSKVVVFSKVVFTLPYRSWGVVVVFFLSNVRRTRQSISGKLWELKMRGLEQG